MSFLGVIERFSGAVYISHLLLLFFPPSYIYFHTTELSCCIAAIFLGTVNHHQFKFGIITLPDSIWNAFHPCSLFSMWLAWHLMA
jgi:hypothetical protein